MTPVHRTISLASADVNIVAEGLRFPEGPVWSADGSVLFVEIAAQRISRVRPNGDGWAAPEVVAEVPGGPNGLAVGPDGALYVCNNGGCFTWNEIPLPTGTLTVPGHPPDSWTGGSIDRVDPATGERTVLYRDLGDRSLRAPNDLVFDAHGGFWFTDHGVRWDRTADRTGVYYARADGSRCTEVIHPLDSPNGIGLSPDGTKVYVAETHTGRVLYRSIVGEGVVAPANPITDRGLLAGLDGFKLLDSLAVDGEGWVCVATLAESAMTAISPDGSIIERYEFPPELADPLVTNICFGGPDLRTAFVTLSGTGRLVSFHWPRPGLSLAHQLA